MFGKSSFWAKIIQLIERRDSLSHWHRLVKNTGGATNILGDAKGVNN